MGRVVAQSVVMFSAAAAALGALGAMGAILRALSGRADISMCRLLPLLLWRVISIPKGRNVEARLFIRRLSTCSLTDDLFQPVVEIARRTFPRLALLLLHEHPDSINVLFAEPCTPVITSTGKGPVGAERRRAAAAQQRVTHLGEQCTRTVDDGGLRAIQHERALTRDPTPNHEGTPPVPPMTAMHVAIRVENQKWFGSLWFAGRVRPGWGPVGEEKFRKNI